MKKITGYICVLHLQKDAKHIIDLSNLPCIPIIGDILIFNLYIPKGYTDNLSTCVDLIVSTTKITKKGYDLYEAGYELDFIVTYRFFDFEEGEVAIYLDFNTDEVRENIRKDRV